VDDVWMPAIRADIDRALGADVGASRRILLQQCAVTPARSKSIDERTPVSTKDAR
jgi:hypothetical protein